MRYLKYGIFSILLMFILKSNVYARELEVVETNNLVSCPCTGTALDFSDVFQNRESREIVNVVDDVEIKFTAERSGDNMLYSMYINNVLKISYTTGSKQMAYMVGKNMDNENELVFIFDEVPCGTGTDYKVFITNTKFGNKKNYQVNSGSIIADTFSFKHQNNLTYFNNTAFYNKSNGNFYRYSNMPTNGVKIIDTNYQVILFDENPNANYDNYSKIYIFKEKDISNNDNFPTLTSWTNHIIGKITEILTLIINDLYLTLALGILFIIFIIGVIRRLTK